MAAHLSTKLHFIAVLALIPLAFTPSSSLTFNLTAFRPGEFRLGDGSEYQNNASIKNGSLVLTSNSIWTTGRVVYNDLVHLWDAASGSLSDFSTRFAFVIDSRGEEYYYSDGLAFFLAPVGFPPPDLQEGGGLGVASWRDLYGASAYPFVAVEFDTFQNTRFKDLPSDHVGIDVSSMESVAGVKWKSSVADGRVNQAWVEYKAVTKELSVVFTGFESNATVLQRLNCTVDLRRVLPEYVCLGFGAATGSYSAVHSIESWWFDSKLVSLNETPVSSQQKTPKDSTHGKLARGKTGLVAGSAAGAVVVAILLLGFFVLWRKFGRSGRGNEFPTDAEFEKQTGPKRYSYKALQRATSHFDSRNKLGEGGFGGVYKGSIDGAAVAIKRVSKGSRQGVKEYASEVRVISQLRHRNLVQLSGWCHERDELLLVYEFMPNGSLDAHLHESGVALTWATRYKIVQGLASALLYLHEGWDRYVVHRDIKSSNVMLDSGFNARLGDFGLARLVDHQKLSATTVLAGTRGYMDPESVITGKTTKQSDVYSFGVLALEIACGRKPIDVQAQENEVSLIDWVYDLNQEGKAFDAADPKLNKAYNSEELRCLLIVGLWCAQPSQVSRPSMRQVNLVLNFEAPLPILPARVPCSFPNRPADNSFSQSYTESSFATTSSSIHSNL